MILSIHQPETYPQLSYFDKIIKSDTFIFLDHVQFRKNYFQNRNTIFYKNEKKYLTIPIRKKTEAIFQKKIIDAKILNKHYIILKQFFGKETYFNDFELYLRSYKETDSLAEYNIQFIEWICQRIDIKTKFFRSHTMSCSEKKSDLILEICKKKNANVYYSGLSGKDYLEQKKFLNHSINISFQNTKKIYSLIEKYGHNKNISVIQLLIHVGFSGLKEIILELNDI